MLAVALALGSSARAHPMLQNSLWVVVESNRLAVRVTATWREVVVVQQLVPDLANDASRAVEAELLWRAAHLHTNYLLSHVEIFADGRRLAGRVTAVLPSAESSGLTPETPAHLDQSRIRYDLEYPLPDSPPARVLRFRQSTLAEFSYAPGISWDPHYALRVKTADRSDLFNGVLRRGPETAVELPAPAAVPPPAGATNETRHPASEPKEVRRGIAFSGYFGLGVHHILGGWDHLLFLAALTLAAAGLWDLFKLIAAFTLAHSLTVTLSVLHLVDLPSWFVEPVIAGSIVFVAVENLFWPAHARTKERLVVAFGFGLVHGLGFAGGLKEAVVDVTGTELATAVVAFCAGVESGNLAIGLPLLGVLLFGARQWPAIFPRKVARAGSVIVALGGAYYLVMALRSYV